MVGVALACSLQAQTYQLGPQASAKPQGQTGKKQAKSQSLGFGSNIQDARLGRAAELALQQKYPALALSYAQRAAQAAPNDPQLWFLVGYAARLDGKLSLAVESYQHGLRLAPSAAGGLSGLAQTYAVMGRVADAQALLEQVLASHPRRRDDALLLGNVYMRSGDYKTALDWLHKAERMKPDARAELLLAISFQHLNQMASSKHYLDLAIHRAPNNPEVQRALAGYYRTQGNYPAAIAELIAIKNPRPDVKAELAFTYELDGKPDLSAKLYAEAADAEPRNMALQLSAAQAQIAAGSVEGSDPFLARARKLDPNYYRLHAILGEIAALHDHNDAAVQEYSAALAHLPATPIEGPLYGITLHVNLMDAYKKLHNDAAASQQLDIAHQEIGALNEQGAERTPFLRLRALIKMYLGDFQGGLNDMKEALALSPRDPNNLQLDGDLLMKLGRTEDAIAVYKRVLGIDPRNRFALISLGYASRTVGRDPEAQRYFERLARDYPTLYIPYLALGDMYTAHRDFAKAQASYRKAYALAPKNALITAGGMNSAIESQKLDLAAVWLGRATPDMRQDPQMLKETERYLRFKGDFQQSAEVGRQAIKVLPGDRDVVVYLGYDLLSQGKYDELLQLTTKYNKSFPKEPDIPLLAGYVHQHNGQLALALVDFTEALKRDPTVVTAYVNRGYILNDLHRPEEAAADFAAALKLDPKDGQAHLGLAYAALDLNRSAEAVRQSQLAEQVMGDSVLVHVIRATAYGREGYLTKAIAEYHAALKFSPNDGALHFGLGNAYFTERHYHDAVDELHVAEKLTPDNPDVYAMLARSYAYLQDREQTLRYVQLAEQHALHMPTGTKPGRNELSEIYVATGQALSTLGDQKAAMERFRKALEVPDSDRVTVRLAIAQLWAQQDHTAEAQRQIALAQMEAEAGVTAPVTGAQFIDAADIFREIHEYQLSQTYVERAKAAGAPDIVVRIGLANNYLAIGDTARAEAELAAVRQVTDSGSDYQYLLAEAALYEQEHRGSQAVTAFAEANSAAGEDQAAERQLLNAAGNEGYRVNSTLSVLGNLSVQPIYETTTVYVLDAKLDGPVPVPPTDIALLPPPRSSLVSQGYAAFHLHFGNFIPTSGFFQIRNARGQISVPQTGSIVNRDTTDYSLSYGVNPTVHFGRNSLTFNSGVQGTIRRDSKSPKQLNQNLFRAFAYMSSTSFFDAISVSGYGIYEAGPYTESDIHSRAIVGAINFRVGAPWARTALVTGWGSNDQVFTPVGTEDYYTSSYAGLTHEFSRRFSAEGLVEDLRAWRVFSGRSGIAQALIPAGTFDFTPNHNWSLHASGSYSNNRSFHPYDQIEDSVYATYTRPFRRTLNDKLGDVHVEYPIRFSAGFQQQTFYSFTGHNETFRPYVSITIF